QGTRLSPRHGPTSSGPTATHAYGLRVTHVTGLFRYPSSRSVPPSAYYFRTTPRFETGHAKYAFLNRLLAVSSGDRRPEGPVYTIDEIL
ncbi:MAG: DUF3237 family protein, partial [Myxococcaceae bacterium]